MRLVTRGFEFLGQLMKALNFFSGAIILFLTLLISADVAMRYFFNHPIENATEITEHALLFIAFLSAAWILRKGGHVEVDIIYNQLGPRSRRFLDCLNPLLGAMVCLAFTWFSVQATWLAYERGTVFATTWRLPRAPILAVIPVGSLLLFLEYLRQIFQNLSGEKRNESVGRED